MEGAAGVHGQVRGFAAGCGGRVGRDKEKEDSGEEGMRESEQTPDQSWNLSRAPGAVSGLGTGSWMWNLVQSGSHIHPSRSTETCSVLIDAIATGLL